MAKIHTAVYVAGELVEAGLAPEEAVRLARERRGMVWIGVSQKDAAALDSLADLLSLHPLAVRDCLRGHQRSRIDRFDDLTFIVLQPARYHDDTETVEISEVALFAGSDFVVTVQPDGDIDEDEVRARLQQHPEVLAQGPYALVWAVCEATLLAYGPVLAGVENDIDEIEQELFSDSPDVSRRIFGLQREVIDLQHATSPLPDLLARVRELVMATTGKADAPAFREVEDRARQVTDRVDGFRNTLQSALSVHATLVEQQNNEAMRRMTEFSLQQNDQVKKVSSWAAILFAPTLVGTIYGMNFEHMPELAWQWGYPMALGLMALTSGTLYAVFKRRGWL